MTQYRFLRPAFKQSPTTNYDFDFAADDVRPPRNLHSM